MITLNVDLSTIEERLKAIIAVLVEPYRTSGDVFTWRMMREIEAVAIQKLRESDDIDPGMMNIINVLRAPPAEIYYPNIDQPVDFGGSNCIAFTFSMIFKAYKKVG
ncbi:MAG: hypothetical protein V4495_22470 [Pseudomonadota bacterium]